MARTAAIKLTLLSVLFMEELEGAKSLFCFSNGIKQVFFNLGSV